MEPVWEPRVPVMYPSPDIFENGPRVKEEDLSQMNKTPATLSNYNFSVYSQQIKPYYLLSEKSGTRELTSNICNSSGHGKHL